MRLFIVLALSIAALPDLVNGRAHANDSSRGTAANLIETILKNGIDSSIGGNLAPAIGLPKPMPMKKQEVVTGEHDNDVDKRAFYVIYEKTEDLDVNHAVCAYTVKIKHSGLDRQTRYFRIDLNGKLEKAVLTQTKYEASGKAVRGSGVKFDQDIDSPEVKKTFEAEMKFWLKDWLKKEMKAPAKKAV